MKSSWLVIGGVILLIILGIYFYTSSLNNSQVSSDASEKQVNDEEAIDVKSQASPNMDEGTPPTEGVIELKEQNGSGETGRVVFTQTDGKTKVVITMNGAPATAQPAHIHIGACPEPGAVKYPLNDVIDGRSETTLETDIKGLMSTAPMAVNVHKSQAEVKTYVACGDLSL